MNKHTVIGIDLAKNVFHIVILNQDGKQLKRKKPKRSELSDFIARQELTKIALEACGSAHHWARQFKALGHEVDLLPPQHVRGYLRGQKNDYNDASAIAEACLHNRIRPVPLKSIEQQDEQGFHRIRRQLTGERTRLSNQLRGLLSEYGIVIAEGACSVRNKLPEVLEDAENGLTPRMRELLHRQYQRLLELDKELSWYDEQLAKQSKTDEVCQRLMTVPGIGPVVSSALKSWMGDGRQFDRGRDASAALGVVPRQHSSGDKPCLLGISKRGDSYLRSLVIHGARSVVSRAKNKTDPLSLWINGLVAKRGVNKAVVALANKLVRIAWVIIARGETYQPRDGLCVDPA